VVGAREKLCELVRWFVHESGRIPFDICVLLPRAISGAANGAVRDSNEQVWLRQLLK
jgi:hypothetical protein